MRVMSPAMIAALADPTAQMHVCWRITRVDGAVKCFTDADISVFYNNEEYTPHGSTNRSAFSFEEGMRIDNIDITGIVDQDNIDASDLLSGLYDGAEVVIFAIFSNRPDLSIIPLIEGRFGGYKINRGSYHIEMDSLAYQYSAKVGELTGANCRARLGDARCKVNLIPYIQNKIVAAINPNNKNITVSQIANPDMYQMGHVEILTGAAAGEKQEIQITTNTLVITYLPFKKLISVGDTLRMFPGCNGTRAVCKNIYNNLINIRCEPDLPGNDQVLKPRIR